MYEIGDLVFYGNTGVCRVTEITMQALPGQAEKRNYYTMKPLFQECVIHTPVEGGKVFMRPVISRQEAERLVEEIPNMHAEAYHSRVQGEVSGHYEAALNTHCCADLIELTMSIYAKKRHLEEQKRRFGTVDERFMKRAEELLFGELSAVLEIPRDRVPAYIATCVEGKGVS